jgi:tRNA (guanine37-N1)-methyltransferase
MSFAATIYTLFPEMFPGPLGMALAGRAAAKGIFSIETHDLRQHGTGPHRKVDDTPFGGGAGMVIAADVIAAALDYQEQGPQKDPRKLIFLTPRGRQLTQADCQNWSQSTGLRIVCGRYEGIDQRVIDASEGEEISIGDYVLSGGEPAALVLLDAVIRLLPGVMGDAASAIDESFSHGLLEYPQFTRPSVWRGVAVPNILLSGDHGAIEKWRREQAEHITRQRRPDLWAAFISSGSADAAASFR